MIFNGETQLLELSGEAPELMGRSFLRRGLSAAKRARRLAHRFDPHAIALREARAALSGFDEMEGDEMGRSFLRRRAAAAARVARKTTRAAAPLVRKISHRALNVAAKIPGYGSLVSAAREMQQRPGGPAYNLPAAPAAPGALDVAPAAPEIAPSAGMSTTKKILIGGGVAAALVGIAIVVKKRR
jgi:hypothetical protein